MLFKYEKMFPNDKNAGKHSLVFMAGFHINIPFYLYPTQDPSSWNKVKDQISQRISQSATHFQIAQMDYHPETFFPLDKPLTITYTELFDVFALSTYIQEKRLPLPPHGYKFDHLIWICPTGVILVMVQISFDGKRFFSLAQLEEIVEEHYVELTFIFNEIADVIFACIPTEMLSPLLCSTDDIEKCKQAIAYNRELVPSHSGNRLDSFRCAGQSIRKDPKIFSLYEDILFDVYFIDFVENPRSEEISIRYKDASIKSLDRSYLPLLGIGFSTFVGFLWIQKHLRCDLHKLQSGMNGASMVAAEGYGQLKLFRMFVISFIVESSPINVRLKAAYMKQLQEFWKAEEMNTLVDQIKNQLGTLEEMFKWIEDSASATRTFRFAVGGLVFALLSVISTVNTLITTFDGNKHLGLWGRIAIIFMGLVFVGLLYLGVWRLKLPGRGQKKLGQAGSEDQ